MAKNNLEPLVGKFLARSRRRQSSRLTTTPDVTATAGYRPAKRARVTPYRPVKRSRRTGY